MTTTQCAVTKGDLPMNITWFLNNQPIDAVHGVTVAQMNKRISTLSIESVEAVHSGEYSCLARNAAGESVHTTKLFVNGTSKRFVCSFVVP